MLCPVCKNVELVMSDRQGIEIDYCPSCRGVWLDRGELDKLIERSVQLVNGAPVAAVYAQEPARGHGNHPGFKDSDYAHGKHSEHGQRRTFWRELFD